MRAKYVYHVDTEIVHDVIDGVLYSVPPGEPYEFVNPFFAERFIQHKWFNGVVEVELERTRSGWIFKVEDAHRRAVAALAAADESYNNAYIETQQQDRLMQGRPAAPPSVRQKKILARQSVNLEEFGIRPVGTKSNQDKMLEAVMEQNRTMMAVLQAMIVGGDIKSALSAQMGRQVSEPEHVTPEGENVLVPPPSAPRNIVAPLSAVEDRPDPPQRAVRLYGEGEEVVVPGRASDLGPEFEGDVNDPNAVPGPRMPVAHDPLDLNKSGLAEALNGEEDRVKLKVPSPGQRQVQRPRGPVSDKNKERVTL